MVKHAMGLTVRLVALLGLVITAAGFMTPSVPVVGATATLIQSGTFLAPGSGAAGTVTIISLSNNRVIGDFSFDATGPGAAPVTKLVRNWHFDFALSRTSPFPTYPDQYGSVFSGTIGGAPSVDCFYCYDWEDMGDACRAEELANPGYTYHLDGEFDVNGNVYGDPHGPNNCVGNSYGNTCGQAPGAHGNECLMRQEDVEDLQIALGRRDFSALAALVSDESGHVKFSASRGSIQITSCGREFIDANIRLSKGDLRLLQNAIRSNELRQATKTE